MKQPVTVNKFLLYVVENYAQAGVVAGISVGHVWGTSGTFLVGEVRRSSSILISVKSTNPYFMRSWTILADF
ncbi:hypothetical protein ACQLT9_004877 [Salmonella enterica subsp. diarizonae]